MAIGQYSFSLTVRYDANGGESAPQAMTRTFMSNSVPYTATVTLSAQTVSKRGYSFLGWSLSSSATTASYQAGGSFSHVFSTVDDEGKASATITLYAVFAAATYAVSYNKGQYGTGSNVTDMKTYNVDLTLRGAIFTRSGYTQTGWATEDGGAKVYNLGGIYAANVSIMLYPAWSSMVSTFTISSSVIANGTDTGTITITRYSESYTHRITISLGSESVVYTGIATSKTFTIPVSWSSQIPNATSALATCVVETFSGSTRIGSASKTFTILVPGWVKPTVSVTGTNNSSNSTVSGWGILVQSYSTITLTATAAGSYGSTITNIAFTGDGVEQAGTATSATSAILSTSGSRTWTVTVTDSRGRTGSATLTRTVYEYFKPWAALTAYRSDSSGAEAPADGTYITATGRYGFASCNNNNSLSVRKIEYKLKTASSWTTAQDPAVSETAYTFGTISVLSEYNVRITVTDAVGNTARLTTNVASVEGYSFGLNGKCVRFGGPIRIDDAFECDFRALMHDDLTVDGRIYASGTMQSGTVSVRSVNAGSVETVAVAFDHAFSAVPTVVACLYGSQTTGLGDCSASVWDLTATGFSMRLENNYSSRRDLGATWIAIL